jgi:O-antigen/teichoic acid export membrane protein
MTSDRARLSRSEQRSLVYSTFYRVVGTPVVVGLGLANTAIIVRETGASVFGLVSLVATVTLLLPFADLGIGATVLSASAMLGDSAIRGRAVDIIARAYRVLFAVAGGVIAIGLCVMAFDGWTALVGFSSGAADRWAITIAVGIFALTIPAGLGVRILIGIGKNPLATLVLMSCPGFALVLTLLLFAASADGIWYAVSSLGGVLIGQLIGTVLAIRISGLGWSLFAPPRHPAAEGRLLEGSLWLFVVGVGLPMGLQTGRILLAHLSTPEELSRYALMAQIYGVCWSVVSTAGLAYWPVFVDRRAVREETVQIWWRVTATFAVTAILIAICMALLGPWAASVLSGQRITVTATLAAVFGLLLIAQSVHLPANVLLTRPTEARWQAWWALAMATISVGLGWAVARSCGALGMVSAAALAVFVAQVIPDLAWVPRLVRRRPPPVS